MGAKSWAWAALTLLLTACGKSDGAYIAEACVESGQDRAICDCTAEIYAESLSPRQLEMLASMRRAEAEDGLTEEEAQSRFMEEYGMAELLGLGVASIEPTARASRECS